eukprot:5182937-Amphidinium_carterae.2
MTMLCSSHASYAFVISTLKSSTTHFAFGQCHRGSTRKSSLMTMLYNLEHTALPVHFLSND